MRPNSEYQQTANMWLTFDFNSSLNLNIGDDANTEYLLFRVQTIYMAWKTASGCLAMWLIMLGFMGLRRPSVSRSSTSVLFSFIALPTALKKILHIKNAVLKAS